MDDILWLERSGDGYVSDASRALDAEGEEPCRMALSGHGYGLAIVRDGMTLAYLDLDDGFVIREISVGYAAPRVTPEKIGRLRQFIGRKVLYKSDKEG